ncbi:MAG: fatty acid desaturase [Halioglobus sp.]
MQSRIDKLRQPSNAIFLQVTAIYALIAVCVWSVSSLWAGVNPAFLLASIIAWATIGWCQFALFNALHEGLHRRFGAPHRDWVGYALTAYPVGFDESYRQVHLDHHKFFGDARRDPDFPNYGRFPVSKGEFLLQMGLNLCGWNALLQFLGIRQGKSPGLAKDNGRNILTIALAQLALLGLFAITVGWLYYLWLWLIPLVTFGKFFSSTRAFCEHASPDNKPTIRTITGSLPGEKIFGVFCFHYHAEHHEYVGVPYNQLEQAHEMAADTLYYGEKAEAARYEHFDRGYFQLLRQWYGSLPA